MEKTEVKSRSKLKSLGLFSGLRAMFGNDSEDIVDEKIESKFFEYVEKAAMQSDNKNEISGVKAYKDRQRADVDINRTIHNPIDRKNQSQAQGREHE